MITEIPILKTPDWLTFILKNPEAASFPLKSILENSLYYPASGLNGTPVKYLAGNVYSFIYADYGVTKYEFLQNLNGKNKDAGFKNYHSILQKEIFRDDIVPAGWIPNIIPTGKKEIEKLLREEQRTQPFGHWSVWQRDESADNDVGPEIFSFFFLAGEMSAVYQGLYIRNNIAPKILSIIQPGTMGGEWECVTSDNSFFKKVVKANPAGMPEYLLHGGFGNGNGGLGDPYPIPCWKEYEGPKITRLMERYAGIWKLQ